MTSATESSTTDSSTTDSTSTTSGAREHARAQAGAITDAMPVVPATDWPHPPADIPTDRLTWAESIPGGRYTALTLARGTRIRLTDRDGTACASLMMWRADAPWERLNTADTVKVPWQAYLGTGHPLLSDQGRVLATIVADTSGHHDALCGASTLAGNVARYGAGAPESESPAGRELLLLAALKHGLTERDLPHTVSFFHGVRVADDGALVSTGGAGAGATVDLILHLPVVVAVAVADHPLDPSTRYHAGSVELLAWSASQDLDALLAGSFPGVGDDLEYRRAVANSEAAHRAFTQID
ncbi:urea carboxylase [Dietzia sp. UCD-THP]|uniref:Urea carboxylase n=1 Tax=Dietzia natronolimnaea TaxID=161920 RepID=A0A2A2WRL5_9ACTN|nr:MULTISPECIES: urea amidolyase associated protein UAAP1 [Dietzia]EYT64732.1 urea carboxylase [Dietzia sp. UCD-THP]PAY23827.1 urea carboxylase [Dietzia natronolimnaea]